MPAQEDGWFVVQDGLQQQARYKKITKNNCLIILNFYPDGYGDNIKSKQETKNPKHLMKKAKYIIFLLSILLPMLFTQSAFSQDGEFKTIRDLESWGSLNLKYKINKDWKIGLEEQVRFSNNSSEVDAFFTELNTDYDFSKNVCGGIGLRYIRQNDNVGDIQGFESHMRLHFDLGYKYKAQRLNIDTRIRFQTKNELGISKEQGDYANNNLRLKTGLEYNFKNWKLDPEFSAEIFRQYENGENEFNKLRFTIGTKYNLKAFGKIRLFYRMEKELNTSYPKTTNILGIKYTYSLKSKKK